MIERDIKFSGVVRFKFPDGGRVKMEISANDPRLLSDEEFKHLWSLLMKVGNDESGL